MGKKVAEQLVGMLADAGVKRIYAVTGDSLNEVNDAVRKNGEIEWVHVRHEETGAFAAGAEAQLTGRLACCAGSSGPGHVHLINGVYDAHRSGAPVLVIASACPSTEFGTEYFQETDTIKLFDDCSYYNEMAVTPKQLPRMLQGAMQAAISEKGVGVIGLPGDLAAKEAVEIETAMNPFKTAPETKPDRQVLEKLASFLNRAQKVTLYCGIGAKDAHTELVELSKKLNAPVAYTFKSKMEIQYDNPNEVGLTGLLGMPSGYFSMQEAEILLLLGTDFPYANFMPENNIIVQIDTKAERIGRRAKVDMGICGDVKDTLEALLPLIEQKKDNSFLKEQLSRYKSVKKNLESYIKEQGSIDRIHPEYVAAVIDSLAADDAIFTVDTGMSCVWGARYLHATGKRKMLGSFNHGSMANAMPQAIGAAFAYPGREVIAICGDGGISMLLGDLATIVQYKLPIKIIVFNNRALGMVKLEMEVAGLPDWQTDMYNPDFFLIAKAMGMEGFTISHPDEVVSVLPKALASEGPVLVNVMTDPNALAMPPKIELGQMIGFAQSMFKLMINGRTKEVIDTINSNFHHWKEVL
ncbi:thiamine pyrophosphate-dependent enzyme [Coprobacter tertius]|uniref:Thiamine pyrophosphate-binding protein n=1 Tax=Coprobacter tertius TaxID=2944915 RepID=A0ABT1MJ60_9BACT|nr:thiamine pyrophosphate-dependent enzyme [Coprobacter tertius]MCP9611921.1 thiamine pyrophosphate-binding protein [Coprobacter tertius]